MSDEKTPMKILQYWHDEPWQLMDGTARQMTEAEAQWVRDMVLLGRMCKKQHPNTLPDAPGTCVEVVRRYNRYDEMLVLLKAMHGLLKGVINIDCDGGSYYAEESDDIMIARAGKLLEEEPSDD